MKIPKLGVNIDHVATVRQARRTFEPDPVTAAALATLGGAEVITAHLREDRRHINDRDLRLLRATVFTKLNLEMACVPEIVAIALKTRPEQVTLVPEKRAEITTEGGLEVARARPSLARDIARLKKQGILVSLFIDADSGQVRASAQRDADAVELHTGPYANARSESAQTRHLERLLRAAEEAARLGLRVNAGHGLTYTNVRGLVGALQVEELHIGHSVIARAVMVGLERAVREMCELIALYSKRT